ncbi:MAG: CRR6 family NdhI maturation factor [Cyanothece sp. SIO1E1]|nr:CRR6 family NdhI maturation factor [Cyanothece sp. SIO1E1]
MTTQIALDAECIDKLDLSPAQIEIDKFLQQDEMSSGDKQIRFVINYPQSPDDPRELSEIPEIRLWFIRLDSQYPWLPLILDWEAGELARYTAMLVPHQFNREGIRYNPEALEIFVMQKLFVLTSWTQQKGMHSLSKLKFFAQMLGYELEDDFFELILSHPDV